MSKVLDLKNRNKSVRETSTMVMERIQSRLDYDVFLAAISVIPAAIIWIFTDHFFLALTLWAGIFFAIEYGYPAYKNGRIDAERALRLIASARETISSRIARRA